MREDGEGICLAGNPAGNSFFIKAAVNSFR
jgi:hypothetical protein